MENAVATKKIYKPASQYNFADAETDYRNGSMSVQAIARKHSIPEPTLRRAAKQRGWIRGFALAKRNMVADAMAGVDVTNVRTIDELRQNQLLAASQDVADMNSCLAVARGCIAALLVMVPGADNARDIKVITEANKNAVDTIRRIRGLDDAPASTADAVTTLIESINGTALLIVE